jgi:hypothetical protein
MSPCLTDLLDKTILLIKPDVSTKFVLGTRNKQIAEYLGVKYSDTKLNSFDEKSKTNNIQFFDIINGNVCNIPKITKESIIIGLPLSFPPSLLISIHAPEEEKQKAFEVYYSSMMPLFNKIKEFKNLGVTDFGEVDYLSLPVNSLYTKLNELNITVPESTIPGFITFISASKTLSTAFLKNYEALNFLPSVEYVFKEMNVTLTPTTYNEFCEKMYEKDFIDELKSVYINYLNRVKQSYIEKYNNDLKSIDTVQRNNVLQETINISDLKTQILLQLSQLNELNIESELKNIDSLFVIYKYWPFNTLPPEELGINLPIFNNKDIVVYTSLLNSMDTDDAVAVMVNPEFFVEKLRNIREKQILEHRDKFIQEIENDIKNTEDKDEASDLKDIIEMLRNNSTLYKDELELKRTAYEVLSYWPIMLYPAPSFVLAT